MDTTEVKEMVRARYGGIVAKAGSSCCGASSAAPAADDKSLQMGYTAEELAAVPERAHLGPGGRVIGIDMTHEMLAKARENAAKVGAGNVEFRLGELEHLPVADNTADVAISNCVI